MLNYLAIDHKSIPSPLPGSDAFGNALGNSIVGEISGRNERLEELRKESLELSSEILLSRTSIGSELADQQSGAISNDTFRVIADRRQIRLDDIKDEIAALNAAGNTGRQAGILASRTGEIENSNRLTGQHRENLEVMANQQAQRHAAAQAFGNQIANRYSTGAASLAPTIPGSGVDYGGLNNLSTEQQLGLFGAGGALRDPLVDAAPVAALAGVTLPYVGAALATRAGLFTVGALDASARINGIANTDPTAVLGGVGSLVDDVARVISGGRSFGPIAASQRGAVGDLSGTPSVDQLNAARRNLIDTTRGIARQRAGFSDIGTPVILDSNLQARGLADALRDRGFNIRTVDEIFGNDVGDPAINRLADTIGARVLTRDRGRQLDGGFGTNAIQVDARIRDQSTIARILEEQLK